MSATEPKKVSIAETNRVVKEGLVSSDELRLDGLKNLGRFRVSKAKMLSRETNRLEQKHAKDSQIVRRSNARLTANAQYINGLKMEANRASTQQEKCDKQTWIARGRVYDRGGCPIAGSSLSLYRADGTRIEQVKSVKSDAKGRYQLSYNARGDASKPKTDTGSPAGSRINTNLGAAATEEKAAASERQTEKLQINTNRFTESVFVRAIDPSDDSLCSDSTLMVPELGKCNYRDIIIDTDLSQKLDNDIGKDRRASRFLGNSSTRELHDLKNEKARCQINAIRIDHCFRFKSIKDAQSLDYDFCAYCFGRERSKR